MSWKDRLTLHGALAADSGFLGGAVLLLGDNNGGVDQLNAFLVLTPEQRVGYKRGLVLMVVKEPVVCTAEEMLPLLATYYSCGFDR
jgi:hypothetical protein